ncbi:MAG: FAD-dependent monooxygenase [Microbacterium sp.]
MRIGIIGAGIGGLVAASALQRDGHDVTVFERAADLRPIGAGLSLFGNSFAALDAVGLGDRVRAITTADAPPFTAGQRTPSGRWLVTLPTDAVSSLRIVHRADLQEALTGALEPGTIHTGMDASVDPHGAPLLSIDSREERFDIVVAADGIRSRARAALGLDTGLRYSGYTAWRGVTRRPVDLSGEAGETWGSGRRFGIAPLPDGRVYWFATENRPESTPVDDEGTAVLERFGSWHAPIRELIESTDAADVLRHDIHDLAGPVASFVRGRTILLGDAAHPMTPDLGQGAGQAIEGAASIALLLRGMGPDEAVEAYDRVRRPRAQRIASRSRAVGRVAQWESPFAVAVRDALLTVTPGSAMGAASARVQTWTAPSTPEVARHA